MNGGSIPLTKCWEGKGWKKNSHLPSPPTKKGRWAHINVRLLHFQLPPPHIFKWNSPNLVDTSTCVMVPLNSILFRIFHWCGNSYQNFNTGWGATVYSLVNSPYTISISIRSGSITLRNPSLDGSIILLDTHKYS